MMINLTPIPTNRGLMLHDPCAYCGGMGETFDHIDPRSRGGRGPENFTRACQRCNTAKGNYTLIVWLACLRNGSLTMPSAPIGATTRARRRARRKARRRDVLVMGLCQCNTLYDIRSAPACAQCRA